MGYKIQIDAFEGPLDLLLHLIKEAKLDIYDIKIAQITQQYLDYIYAMEEMKLEVASEYLVMAATLIEIKSKSLLPKQVVEIEDEYEEDTQEALIKRLVEYQQYKEVTKELRELEEERGQFYTKPPIDFTEYIDKEVKLPDHLEVNQLISAFEKLLRRHKLAKPLKTRIVAQHFSVEDRMESLLKQIKYKKRVGFTTLFEQFDKEYVVVTFLALLELVKGNQITLTQDNYREDIYIYSVEGDDIV
ncbi:MAG TPA: segregation/condensation protein A [Firmicutes bacterium]|nr:segregation/condensation protein A [Bacillota bacterium]